MTKISNAQYRPNAEEMFKFTERQFDTLCDVNF